MLFRFVAVLVFISLLVACSRPEGQEVVQQAVEAPATAVGAITVQAPDGIEIAATVHGSGQPTVVLVHGWMCDQTYWEEQVPALSKHFGVVTVDLAGHGLSGTDRQSWTIASLGEDVAAVISHLQLEDVVVVGHSMGGRVGLEVASALPGTVIGVIGVDTLQDADQQLDSDEVNGLLAAFESDFTATCGGFVQSMFGDRAAGAVRSEIAADMCSGPAVIGAALIRDYAAYDLAAALQAVDVPVRCVNADKWPTNVQGNRKYADFDAVIVEGHGHFLMQEAPELLDDALIEVVTALVADE